MFYYFIPTTGLVLGATHALAQTLAAYNVDPKSVSVSGLSSGGFMSVQLGVAYSDTFPVGFGVFAGGPYDCARDQSVCFLYSPMMCINLGFV
jgi:poly(3-hydroxybutyrate) depolymerase